MSHELAPPTERCDVCGAAMEWCVGGMQCPDEADSDAHVQADAEEGYYEFPDPIETETDR